MRYESLGLAVNRLLNVHLIPPNVKCRLPPKCKTAARSFLLFSFSFLYSIGGLNHCDVTVVVLRGEVKRFSEVGPH